MMKLRILGAVALLASALASPAMAQQVIQGPAHHYAGDHQRYRHDGRWHDSYNRWDAGRSDRDNGFWPADVAAGAVGTAAATAPIGGDAYARRNGFVCTPGTWFRGEDGRRHICQ